MSTFGLETDQRWQWRVTARPRPEYVAGCSNNQQPVTSDSKQDLEMPHNALLIPELLVHITESIPCYYTAPLIDGMLVPKGKLEDFTIKMDAVSYRTLSSLARVSRKFKGPALDTLWSELPDLSPLGRLLPDGLIVRKPHPDAPRPLGASTPWYDTVHDDVEVRIYLNFFISASTPEPGLSGSA